MTRTSILIFALVAGTEAHAFQATTDDLKIKPECMPPAHVNSKGECVMSMRDIMDSSPPLMMCYMEGFNERRLCALLGDTPGCVKWLADHPDPDKN